MRSFYVKSWVFLLAILFGPTGAYAAWSDWVGLSDNYFEKNGTDTQVVLVLDSNVHSCGWNNAVQLNLSVVGPDTYQMLTAVSLTAWTSGKNIQVAYDGCWGDRAKLIGLKLAK